MRDGAGVGTGLDVAVGVGLAVGKGEGFAVCGNLCAGFRVDLCEAFGVTLCLALEEGAELGPVLVRPRADARLTACALSGPGPVPV